MKFRLEKLAKLHREGRWDIDYHLPAEGIQDFNKNILQPISEAASIIKEKRDPTKQPEEQFVYIDISSIDVNTGIICSPDELVGSEAPSRARKVIKAYDLIISTCRPTRGAIAVVPEQYHNQICSTGFCIIRPKVGVNPFYLHFAIRLDSTLEQFRKFSTGSSYPAILDNDVEKTLIPLPNKNTQDLIAGHVLDALKARENAINSANNLFHNNVCMAINSLKSQKYQSLNSDFDGQIYKSNDILNRLKTLDSSEARS